MFQGILLNRATIFKYLLDRPHGTSLSCLNTRLFAVAVGGYCDIAIERWSPMIRRALPTQKFGIYLLPVSGAFVFKRTVRERAVVRRSHSYDGCLVGLGRLNRICCLMGDLESTGGGSLYRTWRLQLAASVRETTELLQLGAHGVPTPRGACAPRTSLMILVLLVLGPDDHEVQCFGINTSFDESMAAVIGHVVTSRSI